MNDSLQSNPLGALGRLELRARNTSTSGPVALAVALFLSGSGNLAYADASNPCDPLNYGAVADGVTDNTVAIQSAIDACAASGGGFVPFSGGTFLTGPVTLKSHVKLQVNAGATILGTLDQSRYVPAYIGTPYKLNQALISASDATDVGIVGAGTIDGQGGVTPSGAGAKSWWDLARTATFPYASFPFAPSSNGLPRPWLVEFWNTSNVTVQGIHLQNSPMWHLGLRYVTGASISGITVTAPSNSPNTDGIDVVSSNVVAISNVNISNGDDEVAIKSGLPPIYQDPAQPMPQAPTQNLKVFNSTFSSGHGVSVGSEAINGVHNVYISGITMNGTSNGFRIKTGRDRGSQIHDITVSNVTMTNVTQPIVLNSYYPASSPPTCCTDPAQPLTSTTPFVSNITIQNLTATGATNNSFIVGLPESPILNVVLNNVNITQRLSPLVKPMDLRYMTGIFSNVAVSPTTTGFNFTVDDGVSVAGQPIP